MNKELIANWIMDSKGVMIPSFHYLDHRKHDTAINSGGITKPTRDGEYTDISIYSTEPFETIRRFICVGANGINNAEPIKYIPLCLVETNRLKAIIQYNIRMNEGQHIYQQYYIKELEHRELQKL